MHSLLKRTLRSLGLIGLLASLLTLSARAASSSTLTVEVVINAPLSVVIDGSASSTQAATVTPGGAPVLSAATATVRNDSPGLTELWQLSAADAYDQTVDGPGWSLTASTAGPSAPDVDQFAIQALFISSEAAAGDCSSAIPASAWDQPYAQPLTPAPVTYTSSVFASPSVIGGADGLPDVDSGAGDGRMRKNSRRGFCWRIVPPRSVNSAHDQTIYVTITAAVAP